MRFCFLFTILAWVVGGCFATIDAQEPPLRSVLGRDSGVPTPAGPVRPEPKTESRAETRQAESKQVGESDVTFPHRAFVLSHGTSVKSGPASRFYDSDKLPSGSIVEVFRHDPAGWWAIKPPAGSFSLIAQSEVQWQPGKQVGVVASDQAVVWVGSRVEQPEEWHWQVKLKSGDLVRVLGLAKQMFEGEEKTFYRIAPPAGEFRWIARRSVTTDLTDAQTNVDDGVVDLPRELPAQMAADASGVTLATHNQNTNGESETNPAQPAEPDTKWVRPIDRKPTAAAEPNLQSLPIFIDRTPLTEEVFERRREALGIALNELATKPVATWKLEPLKQEALILQAKGPNVVARGVATRLVDQIAGFDELQRVQLGLPAPPPIAEFPTGAPAGSAPGMLPPVLATPAPRENPNVSPLPGTGPGPGPGPVSATRPTGPATAGRSPALPPLKPVEMEGILVRVHNRNTTAKLYALTDDDGNPKVLITAIPGVDLTKHLRQKIRIGGKQLPYRPFEQTLMTAEKISEVEVERR